MTLKEIFRTNSKSSVKSKIDSYYKGRFTGVKSEANFESVNNKTMLKAMILSNDNVDGVTVVAYIEDGIVIITQSPTRTKFNIELLKSDSDTTYTWTEKSLTKALSYIVGKTTYYITMNNNIRYNSKSDLETNESNRLSNIASSDMYVISSNVEKQLQTIFNKSVIAAKSNVSNLVEDDKFMEAQSAMKKIIYSSTYRNISPRAIEITDIIEGGYGNRISDRIESEGINTSTYKTSSLSEIRIGGAKVLYRAKQKITDYFGVTDV